MHLCKSLLKDGYNILGIDNINGYYDRSLKIDRLDKLNIYKNLILKTDISNDNEVSLAFKDFKPRMVVNLAAQAGVRYSLDNPNEYIQSNIKGFINILEGCRHYNVESLFYASSSSVYGGNNKIPYSESDRVSKPLSLYAVTKRSNELMASSYSSLFGFKTTGLRFFTVYGPWGRPDMAIFLFTKKLINDEPIDIFNKGDMWRDFTYIDDIVDGIRLSIDKNYNCEIFNLGSSNSVGLMDMIDILENKLGIKGEKKYKRMQAGDAKRTHSDLKYSKKMLGYRPKIKLSDGIGKFVDWYLEYYKTR